MNIARFYFKRVVLAMVNILAGPPQTAFLQRIRICMLAWLGCRFGPESQVSESLYLFNGRNFQAGRNCRLGAFAKIWDFRPITVGNDLLASHNLVLISANHEMDNARTNKPGPIRIGNNVWIGLNVTVVGPVSIGNNVIVGAHSLVTRDLPDNCVAAGCPAKVIRMLNPAEPPKTERID